MRPVAGTKLLIVDDLQENLDALEAIIRAGDRTIYRAMSGEDALALMLEHEFALAILDVQMPNMDGIELAELMRGTERTRHIPIVFVTAAATELNYAFRGYETGAVDFLYKPLDIAAVRSKVSVFVALDQQRREIERQVSEQQALLQQLQATQADLERAIRMRDEFMSMVAHELRTPLNTLLLDSQVRHVHLERGNLAAFGPEQLRNMQARDHHQVQNMIRLIDDMLDVSRIRSGKLSIRPAETELYGLVERVVNNLAQQAEEQRIQLTLHHCGQTVVGSWDAFRIEQIIVNLLTNALRYGNGKPVEIVIECDRQQAIVQVRDQGIGISEEDQARIFESFERGRDNQVAAGLGLGLYISKQLAEAHGGQLTLQSKIGEGSTFSLILPLLEQSET